MTKCKYCFADCAIGDVHTLEEFEECRATIARQRDDLDRKLEDAVYEWFATESALDKAKEALRWYADPAINGKQEWSQIEGVSVPKYRQIDDDEGDVARGALALIENEGRSSDANRYHQRLGAKWMNDAIVAALRAGVHLPLMPGHVYVHATLADRFEHWWEHEGLWRPKKEERDLLVDGVNKQEGG